MEPAEGNPTAAMRAIFATFGKENLFEGLIGGLLIA
jgi:hypothetical protein